MIILSIFALNPFTPNYLVALHWIVFFSLVEKTNCYLSHTCPAQAQTSVSLQSEVHSSKCMGLGLTEL